MITKDQLDHFTEEIYDGTQLLPTNASESLSRGKELDYFRLTARKIANAFQIPSVWISEWYVETNSFRTLAFIHNWEDYPLDTYKSKIPEDSKVLLEKSFLDHQDLKKFLPDFGSLLMLSGAPYVGFPLKNKLGEVIGIVVIVDKKGSRHREKNIRILEFLSIQIAQELANNREDNFITKTIQSLSTYGSAIKEINKLISTKFNSENELYSAYLKLGKQLLSYDSAKLIRLRNNLYEVINQDGSIIDVWESDLIHTLEKGFADTIQARIEKDSSLFGFILFSTVSHNRINHIEYSNDLVELLAKNLANEFANNL